MPPPMLTASPTTKPAGVKPSSLLDTRWCLPGFSELDGQVYVQYADCEAEDPDFGTSIDPEAPTYHAPSAAPEPTPEATTMNPQFLHLTPMQKQAVIDAMKPDASLIPSSSPGFSPQGDVTIPTPKTGTDWLLVGGAALVVGGGIWYFMKKKRRRR